MMTIAEVLAQEGSVVDVLLDNHLKGLGADYLKSKLAERFALKLDKVSFIKAPMGKGSTFSERLFFLKKYDVLFCLTDGSIFYPTAKKNILHIQSPLVGQPAKNLWGKLKLRSWDLIIFNSEFTREHSKKNWPLSAKVIYPPVDVDNIKPLKKAKYILSVGRFFGYLKDKKHAVLIKAFKELFETGAIKDWSLHLVGSAGEGDKDYLENLRGLAKGIPVKFYPNLGYDKLVRLYGESGIYWHGAGFGEDDPTKMEHFGISTVEAMAGGCVPVVIDQGGQKEIVEDGKSGYLWKSLSELKEFTVKLIDDSNLREKIALQSIKRARSFNKENFRQEIIEITKN